MIAKTCLQLLLGRAQLLHPTVKLQVCLKGMCQGLRHNKLSPLGHWVPLLGQILLMALLQRQIEYSKICLLLNSSKRLSWVWPPQAQSPLKLVMPQLSSDTHSRHLCSNLQRIHLLTLPNNSLNFGL